MASLQIKSGKYYGVFYINGKHKWESLGIPAVKGNKRKAEAALREKAAEYERQLKEGTYKPDNKNECSLTDYLSLWLTDIKDIIKPATYETYEITVNSKIIPYFKDKGFTINSTKASDFTAYFKYLKLNGKKNGGGLSEKSIKNIRGVLSAAFDYAVKDRLIPSNPVLDSRLPTFEKDIEKERVTYTPEQIRKLLATARESESHVFLFLMLALFTGLRSGELQALTWDNVDFEKKLLKVNKSRTGCKKDVTMLVTKPKTASSNRTIPLTTETLEALKAEREKQKEFKKFFGNCYWDGEYDFIIRNKDGAPYTNLRAINRVINRLEEKAELPHCTVHGMRHTVASLLDDNGVATQEISTLLGHSSIYTTERIYIHRKKIAKRENVELLSNAINLAKEV